MKTRNTVSIGCGPRSFVWALICLATANIGMHIHGSIFWAIVDFFFAPLAWLKWFICQEVTLSIIKESFAWFLR